MKKQCRLLTSKMKREIAVKSGRRAEGKKKWLPENSGIFEQTTVAAVRPWRVRQSKIHILWTTAGSLTGEAVATTGKNSRGLLCKAAEDIINSTGNFKRSNFFHTAKVHWAITKKARTARYMVAEYLMSFTEWTSPCWFGGTEYCHGWNPEMGCQMHAAGIVSNE